MDRPSTFRREVGWGLASLAAAGVFLIGCGTAVQAGSDLPDSRPAAADAPLPQASLEACDLLPAATLTEALGRHVQLVPTGSADTFGGSDCNVVAEGGDPDDYLIRIVTYSGQHDFDVARPQDATPLPGIGDDAFVGTLLGDAFDGARAGSQGVTITGDSDLGVDSPTVVELLRIAVDAL